VLDVDTNNRKNYYVRCFSTHSFSRDTHQHQNIYQMTTATDGKIRCVICDKENVIFKCGGCLEEYCSDHVGDHPQELNKQLDDIEVTRDLFRQSLTQEIEESKNHTSIQRIDQWEQNSMKKIQQTAEETRQILLENTNEYIHQTEIK
jgi:hypothetical protein